MENEVDQSMLTSASIDISPIRITLDQPTLRRLLITYDTIMQHSSIDYDKDVVDGLAALRTNTVFFTSSNPSQLSEDPSVESIYNLFQNYHDSAESTMSPDIPFVRTSSSQWSNHHNNTASTSSEFQSVVSDDGTDFHSITETQPMEEDFQSVLGDSSIVAMSDVKSNSDTE